MSTDRQAHGLQTSAPINEAFVPLIKWQEVESRARAHFLGAPATLMLHILVEFVQSRGPKRPR